MPDADSPERFGDAARRLGESGDALAALPGELAAAILLALIAGLILWLAGARVMKATFAAGGVAVGGLVGFLVPALAEVQEIGSAPAPLIGLAIGGTIGLLIALAIFRFSMAMAAAGSFAMAGFLGAAAFLHFAPQVTPAEWADGPGGTDLVAHERAATDDAGAGEGAPPMEAGRGDASDEASAAGAGRIEGLRDDLLARLDEPTAASLERGWARAAGFAGGLSGQIERLWEELTDRERAVLAGVTLAAAAMGLFIGLSAPQRSAAVVSAMAGAAVWLVSFAALAGAVRLPGRDVLAQPPLVWASIWLVVAVGGLIFQFKGLRQPAD